ncbi:MAG: ABC transporter ATP-binding protein [Armatimonadetes bacterium]|nr:ABC transporter ATP-binding protein [Armatimonadota bacterium]
MIVVEGLTKVFNDVPVVKDLSFTVEQGEILGFLGPNGAGKTTTMRILTSYFPPTEGRATVAGFDVVQDSIEVRKRVGYMPENVPLYTDMTVRSYLSFVADAKSVPAREQKKRVGEVMDECSLSERADDQIGTLSKGFRQRVGLAQAIVSRPQVLVLDEPTVGLDPRQIVEIRNLITRLGEKNTVIFSSHILSEVSKVCSRVIIIAGGRIRAIDTPENLESLVRKTVQIVVTVQGGPREKVVETVRAIKGVERVSVEESEGSPHLRLLIEANREDEVRAPIAAKIVHAQWLLLELHQRATSLEDVFMDLTAKDPAEQAETTNAIGEVK